MASYELCRDGFVVKVLNDLGSEGIELWRDGELIAVLTCDLDQLLVTSQGLTYQCVDEKGILLAKRKDEDIVFSIKAGGSSLHECIVPLPDFLRAIEEAKWQNNNFRPQ